MNEHSPTFEQPPRPILFGDNGEFTFVSCIEGWNERERQIDEVTIFFDTTSESRGLTVSLKEAEDMTEGTLSSDYEPGIKTEVIDPQLIFSILQLPSEELLRLSESADIEP